MRKTFRLFFHRIRYPGVQAVGAILRNKSWMVKMPAIVLDIFSLYFVVVVMVSPPPPLPRLEKLDEGEGSIGLLPCRSRQGFWTTLCQVFFRLELSCVLVQFLSVGWFIKGVGYSCSKKVRHCVGLWRRWVFLGPL